MSERHIPTAILIIENGELSEKGEARLREFWTELHKPIISPEPPPNLRCLRDGDKVFLNGKVRVVKSVELYDPCPRCGFHQTCVCEQQPTAGCEDFFFTEKMIADRTAELRGKYCSGAGCDDHADAIMKEVCQLIEHTDDAGAVINELLDMLEAKDADRGWVVRAILDSVWSFGGMSDAELDKLRKTFFKRHKR